MTNDEFRADLLASAASRAEASSCTMRDAFVGETLERLREAGEVPDAETCPETLTGQRGRKLEMDAFAFDEADESLHLYIALLDGGPQMPAALTLSEARDQGFNRILAVFEQARSGWLARSIEESRPLWALARRVERNARPSRLRLHIVTDRPISERIREIPATVADDETQVTYQIWDLTRFKRIHEAHNARDDLVVDFSRMSLGGLEVLPAAVGDADYDAYLAAIPAETLADIFLRYGSRLLEGNVRTFLGRRGNVNKGMARTIQQQPERFFAYNNGIAATASEVALSRTADGRLLVTSATDLQIVNGAQTTASVAMVRRDGRMSLSRVFVPMKLSVVAPGVSEEIIPLISRYANSQNTVRLSDFFANHPFHRRIEECSRRILAPAIGGSQIQTHWYYERARGQYLNDQAGLTPARRQQFQLANPRSQVVTKTDLAKVENCFAGLPDIACKGAEKSFTEFANTITAQWSIEAQRSRYGDDWFRDAIARIILFRAAERLVSDASWYEGGYRAQIVAYTMARLARLAADVSAGGSLDFRRIWAAQVPGDTLERQMLLIGEVMAAVLRDPPQAGQNVTEWAKAQACRKRALETQVPVTAGMEQMTVTSHDMRSQEKQARAEGKIDRGLKAIRNVMERGPSYWQALSVFARHQQILTMADERALYPALNGSVPSDRQAETLVSLSRRCEDAGFVAEAHQSASA